MTTTRRLCVDPGETVGWSIWTNKGKLLGGNQTPLGEFLNDVWDGMFDDIGPLSQGWEPILRADVTAQDNQGPITQFVIEKFALYPWEAKNLAWDEFRTSQLIGALKLIAMRNQAQVYMQPAKIKEQAELAGAEELFVKPLQENRHQNDSIRHGVWHNLMEQNDNLQEKQGKEQAWRL